MADGDKRRAEKSRIHIGDVAGPLRPATSGPTVIHHVETLFPSTIQISELKDAQNLNARLLREIERLRATTPDSRPRSWSSTVYTTIESLDTLHQLEEFAEFRRIVMTEANAFAELLKLDHGRFPLRITGCWFNVYGLKDGQEIHHHPNNIVSGTYYVKAPQGCSGIMFHSPMFDVMLQPPHTAMTPLNSLAAEMPAIEGTMVLFPSWLRHSVRPNPTAEERISISFNLAM